MKWLTGALFVSAAVFAAPAQAASDVVTIYAADGLHDGKGSWFETQFDAFTKATGVKVQYVEAGSGGIVERVAKEKSNPQADVLVTLPPFIQRAEAEGLLEKFTPAAAAQIDGGPTPISRWSLTTELHLRFRRAQDAAGDLRRTARPQVQGQDPVFDARPGRRRHGGDASGHPFFRRQGRRLRLLEEAAGEQRRPVRLDRKADCARQQGRTLCRQRRRADEHVADGRRSEYPRVLARGPEWRAFGAAAALLHRPCRRRSRRRQRQEADRIPALERGPGDRLVGRHRHSRAQGRHAGRRQLHASCRKR